MTIIIDAQLSPSIAFWLKDRFSVDTTTVRDLGLRDATDKEIFYKARELSAVVMTKDDDFLKLQDRLGSPPQIIWITCGNTSNEQMKIILSRTFEHARTLLESGEQFIEIRDTL